MKKTIFFNLIASLIFLFSPNLGLVYADHFKDFNVALKCFNAVREKEFSNFSKVDGYVQLELNRIAGQSWAIEKAEETEKAMKAFKAGFDAAIKWEELNVNAPDASYVVNQIVLQILPIYPAGAKMTLLENREDQFLAKIIYGDLKPWLNVAEKTLWTIQINENKAGERSRKLDVDPKYYSIVKAKEIIIIFASKLSRVPYNTPYRVFEAVDTEGNKYRPGPTGLIPLPGFSF